MMNSNFDYNQFSKMNCSSFIEYLLSLSANELSLLAIGLGFLLSANIDNNQQSSLGNFFELIGQLLLTLSAQNLNLYPNYSNNTDLAIKVSMLEKEIELLKKSILLCKKSSGFKKSIPFNPLCNSSLEISSKS